MKACTSVQTTLNVIGGKWKLVILWYLHDRTMRFGELSRAVTGITQKMLTQQLREMEDDNLIERKVYAVVPPKVEYTITDYGKSLEPVLRLLDEWGRKHVVQVKPTAALGHVQFPSRAG